VELATLLYSCKNACMYGSSVPVSPFIHSWDGARQFHSNSAAPRAIQRRPNIFPLSVGQMRIELPRPTMERVAWWFERKRAWILIHCLALLCHWRSFAAAKAWADNGKMKINIMKYMCRARKEARASCFKCNQAGPPFRMHFDPEHAELFFYLQLRAVIYCSHIYFILWM
jgi:hypothetical protein